ncbi:uncharacterized protein NPIL_504061 [Nephila pilipes]|uniref:Uncharacterized protein n=1 Tax=Nephila pilipes TaxID=299642 RepID=A0A8X6PX21_NEPPI|nr:uncharacterized protein NPIL_504061 [Nephila pilipes]
MELLKPERFDIDPTCANMEAKWSHWKRTFGSFLQGITNISEGNKLTLLYNYVSSSVCQYINDCSTYAEAIMTLDSLFLKKQNVIFPRHCLSTKTGLIN